MYNLQPLNTSVTYNIYTLRSTGRSRTVHPSPVTSHHTRSVSLASTCAAVLSGRCGCDLPHLTGLVEIPCLLTGHFKTPHNVSGALGRGIPATRTTPAVPTLPGNPTELSAAVQATEVLLLSTTAARGSRGIYLSFCLTVLYVFMYVCVACVSHESYDTTRVSNLNLYGAA